MSGAIDNTQRRKWDKDEYAARAAAREREEEEKERAKTVRPPAGAIVERQTLSLGTIIQRDYKADLEARVGTKQIVNPETGEGMGFICKESGKVLRDSMSYLDHINGKKQQRALGLSMRVERSTVDQVKARFDHHKRKKEEEFRNGPVNFSKRMALAEEDEEELKRARKERKYAKKEQKAKEVANDAGGDEIDPELAAMMGFGGFGGGKK